MRRILFILVAACGSHPAPVTNHASERVPEVRLVATGGLEAHFLRTSQNGIVVERTHALPLTAGGLAWGKGDPLVVLTNHIYAQAAPGDPKRDGEVGALRASGYLALPAIPDATWPAMVKNANNPEMSKLEQPRLGLIVDRGDDVWLSHCGYWGGPDGGWCDQVAYLRLTGPQELAIKEPDARGQALPKLAPSPRVRIDKRPQAGQPPIDILECRDGATTTIYPPEDKRLGFAGIGSLEPLATEPLLYDATRVDNPEILIETLVVFEGCAASDVYHHVLAGPQGVVAVYGKDKLALVWHGRVIGTTAGADHVSFAP